MGSEQVGLSYDEMSALANKQIETLESFKAAADAIVNETEGLATESMQGAIGLAAQAKGEEIRAKAHRVADEGIEKAQGILHHVSSMQQIQDEQASTLAALG